MTTEIFRPAGGTSMRVTQVDICGNPLTNGCYAVSECWASVEKTAEYADAQEFAPVNANGQLCFASRVPPGLKWFVATITLNAVDPVMWQIMTGAPLVVDDATPTANTVGFRTRRDQIESANFALELWLRQAGGTCTPGNVPYIYSLFPLIQQGKFGDLTVGQDVINFRVTEALVLGPTAWGVGPYDIRKDATDGAPEPLLTAMSTTIGSDDLEHYQITTLGPPPPTSGCQDITPTMTVAPLSGASPLAVVATHPLGADGNPILPAIIEWGDATPDSVVTSGTTTNHTYTTAGTRTAIYRPTGYSSPPYLSAPIVAS